MRTRVPNSSVDILDLGDIKFVQFLNINKFHYQTEVTIYYV